jgi:hypothetical protein
VDVPEFAYRHFNRILGRVSKAIHRGVAEDAEKGSGDGTVGTKWNVFAAQKIKMPKNVPKRSKRSTAAERGRS